MHEDKKIPAGLKIFPLDIEDLGEVLKIEEVSYPNPWSRNIFEKELKNSVSTSFIARVAEDTEDALAAYVFFWIVHGEAHILNLTVNPDFRELGIARKLLGFTLDFMMEKGVLDCFLEVRRSNIAAINLYESYGFKEFYVRDKYYGDEDAIVMGLTINDSDFIR
ncbi:MAG: ribosomal protein S18-alanine N-acetyltransferase [Thermodesulfobacteriota bacterium]